MTDQNPEGLLPEDVLQFVTAGTVNRDQLREYIARAKIQLSELAHQPIQWVTDLENQVKMVFAEF